MSNRARKVPSYCLHKASGRAVVRIDGVDVYLGAYGSRESHGRYSAVIAEWRNRNETAANSSSRQSGSSWITITELIGRYKEYATQYYSWQGQPTGELQTIRYSLRLLRQLYGDLPAAEFGPLALKAVRQSMIEAGWCRQLINRRIGRIKRFFKWAVGEELISPAVWEALRSVDGLREGRTQAREAAPVLPVADETVDATLPFLSPTVAAMVRLQRLTGMRPGEVIQMRPCDIDRCRDVWSYEPARHKNRWRGRDRVVALGPQAQSVLRPYLDRAPDACCFQPREAEAWRNMLRKKARETPMTPSQLSRRPNADTKRQTGDFYTVDSYRRAVTYAIKKAGRAGANVDHWHPNQLRHTRATEIRKEFGIEAAQVSLGHAHAAITEVYAARDYARAEEIARSLG